MIKIRAKLVPKLMLLSILIITVFTGVACTFVTAKEYNKRYTKLDFECTEAIIWPDGWIQEVIREIGDVWILRAYKKASLNGTIDGIPFDEIGYDELNLYIIMDTSTGEYITFGTITMYIEWDGLVGSFSGFVIASGVSLVRTDGYYALRGHGDFKGWKLFGIVWAIDPYWGINGLSGTILIPN